MSRSDERNVVFWAGMALVVTGMVWVATGRSSIAIGLIAGGAALLIFTRFSPG